jgi:hypothetical protein
MNKKAWRLNQLTMPSYWNLRFSNNDYPNVSVCRQKYSSTLPTGGLCSMNLKKAVGTQKNRITADKAWKKDFIKILKDSPAG